MERYYIEELGDYLHLKEMAACNACADFREERRRIVHRLYKVCGLLGRGLVGTSQLSKAKDLVRTCLVEYVKWFARYRRCPSPALPEEVIDAVLAAPSQFLNVIGRLPALFGKESLES